MCTDPHATKERQKVHSTTRTPWKAQPFPSTAEIDSIVPGMTTILSDRGMREQHTHYIK